MRVQRRVQLQPRARPQPRAPPFIPAKRAVIAATKKHQAFVPGGNSGHLESSHDDREPTTPGTESTRPDTTGNRPAPTEVDDLEPVRKAPRKRPRMISDSESDHNTIKRRKTQARQPPPDSDASGSDEPPLKPPRLRQRIKSLASSEDA
jgi:hypothetical protein